MNSTEFSRYIADTIAFFGSADAALKAAQNTPAPYKMRKAKKLFKKMIRTYKYHHEQQAKDE